jgi:DNA-binding transcriptional ArsR family regulator
MAHGSAILSDGVTRPSTQAARSPAKSKTQPARATGAGKASAGALDTLFGALADPTRRMLVERLLTKGPATATTLAETTPLTRQAILKHLQVLESAGLLAHERAGREVRYRVTPQPLAAAVGWILDTAGQWDSRIDRLRGLDN